MFQNKKKDMKKEREEKEEITIFTLDSMDAAVGLLAYVLTIAAFYVLGGTFSVWATLFAPIWLCVCMIVVAVIRNIKRRA